MCVMSQIVTAAFCRRRKYKGKWSTWHYSKEDKTDHMFSYNTHIWLFTGFHTVQHPCIHYYTVGFVSMVWHVMLKLKTNVRYGNQNSMRLSMLSTDVLQWQCCFHILSHTQKLTRLKNGQKGFRLIRSRPCPWPQLSVCVTQTTLQSGKVSLQALKKVWPYIKV